MVLAINELRVHEDAVGGDRELAGTFSLPVSPIITQLAEVRVEKKRVGRGVQSVCSERA